MSTQQNGTGLLIKGAPKFADFIVKAGTWKEKDNTSHLRTDGSESEVVNYCFWSPGVDASATLIPKAGETPAVKGDLIAESSPGTRTWLVLEVENSSYGGTPLEQNVQLVVHTGVSLAEVA